MHGILSPMMFRIFKSGARLISHAINRLVLFHQIDFLKLAVDSLHFTSQFGGFIGDIGIHSLLYGGNARLPGLETIRNVPLGQFAFAQLCYISVHL